MTTSFLKKPVSAASDYKNQKLRGLLYYFKLPKGSCKHRMFT